MQRPTAPLPEAKEHEQLGYYTICLAKADKRQTILWQNPAGSAIVRALIGKYSSCGSMIGFLVWSVGFDQNQSNQISI